MPTDDAMRAEDASSVIPAPPAFDLFPPPRDDAERRRLWLQVVIVIGVGVVPVLYSAIVHAIEPVDQRHISTWDVWARHVLVHSIAVIATLLSVNAIAGEKWSLLGLRRPSLLDPCLVVGLYLLTSAAHTMFAGVVYEHLGYQHSPTREMAGVTPTWWLFCVAHVVNGFSEELVIWGVLYTRLRRLWRRTELLPIFIAAGVFASYHVYQGTSQAVMVFLFGLVHGVFFRLTKRLWPMAIEHGLGNIVNHFIW